MASHPTTTFEDLSGISTASFTDPYDALLSACNNNPEEIETRYALHRTTRNAQQKGKLLSNDFPGVNIDPILLRLTDQTIEPGYVDPRHCLVFWARPPQHIKGLIGKIQKELLTVAPNLWPMPLPNLHMTVLEITHSRTAPEISALVSKLTPSLPPICSHTLTHRALLIKPLVSYDASALALSFVPASKAPSPSSSSKKLTSEDGIENGDENAIQTAPEYSYHHLRRDIYALCTEAGMSVDSRYVVPSAHLTIGRFITGKDFQDEQGNPSSEKLEAFINKIDEINAWLEKEYWPSEDEAAEVAAGGEWWVGEEKGLVCREGRLWYGDGETVYLGEGYEVQR
ncbi:uncharacterized protein EI97DRAFT_437751 [Westerdykella ornata]|uniref:RNA ligase/cyclic nucleotide phosphodiesterase n=1 Tax=Westerdykella ornata TaxID=318751 RepID=A0A6A6J7E3_WESOR|nr:uncharacterized protein EI97DRAFT_437751 [Westerdykella ornata]KAF2271566.1 hypothetical protein EI97DRAFT_437751 [Westerdykella ornata]